jgi:hypothetical protein
MIERQSYSVLSDLQAIADAVDSGEAVDPELCRRVQERAQESREELAGALGVQDIGVDLIREARNAR